MSTEREDQLEAALKKLWVFTSVIVGKLEVDPKNTKLEIEAIGPNGQRILATVSLDEIFAECRHAVPDMPEFPA